jgi:hypothetical protein
MGWLAVVSGAIATALFWSDDQSWLLILAAIAAVGSLWSYGVMHNFAVESARRRQNYSGAFYDFRVRDLDAVPNWLAKVNFLFSVGAFILLIVAVVMKLG